MKTPAYDNSLPAGVYLFAICNVLGVGQSQIKILLHEENYRRGEFS
jgi:hypothetical protein